VGANAVGDAADAGQDDDEADLSQGFPPNTTSNNPGMLK
jgi:hypothetical protein